MVAQMICYTSFSSSSSAHSTEIIRSDPTRAAEANSNFVHAVIFLRISKLLGSWTIFPLSSLPVPLSLTTFTNVFFPKNTPKAPQLPEVKSQMIKFSWASVGYCRDLKGGGGWGGMSEKQSPIPYTTSNISQKKDHITWSGRVMKGKLS